MEQTTRDGKIPDPIPTPALERWGRPLLFGVLGLFAYALSRLLPLFPALAEATLGDGRAALPVRMLSLLTGRLGFSVAEVVLAIYGFSTLVFLVKTVRETLGSERQMRRVSGALTRRLLVHGGVAVVLFYGLWGFSYARPSLAERSDWPPWDEPEVEEMVQLTSEAVSVTNHAYELLRGSDDGGNPTPYPASLADFGEAVRQGSIAALEFLPANQSNGRGMPAGQIKRPWLSTLMARFGMSGVFFPFTGEPHVVRGLPAASALQAFAHERAHLWGFANEAEASFAGYLANALAPDPLAQYAAALFASNQMLRVLGRLDRDQARRLRLSYSPGVERDLKAVSDFWAPYRGIGQRLGSAVNDRYLRANRVAGGTDSYARASRLLIEFARRNGGLVPVTGSTGE